MIGGWLDARGTRTRFNNPGGLTVDQAGSVVMVDYGNRALRTVSKAGAIVSTLEGNGEAGSADGQGADATLNDPCDVVLASNSDLLVSNAHAIRVVTPSGAVRTLAGIKQAGFVDGQGPAARFNTPQVSRWTPTVACLWRIPATMRSAASRWPAPSARW